MANEDEYHLPLIKQETSTMATAVANRCKRIACIFHSVN